MQQTLTTTLHKTALLTALIAAGLFAGCSGGAVADAGADAGTGAADAAVPMDKDTVDAPTQAAAAAAVAAPADFEGTMQQVVISLGSDAVRTVAGSTDLQAVLALSPDRLIKAVRSGEIKADSITKSTLEIDGRKGRFQDEGESGYSILDGEQMTTYVVIPEDRMIMTMAPGALAAVAAGSGKDAGPVDLGAEKIGKSEIRGFDTTGYRFKFMDNIAIVWLSEELEAQTGAFFGIWSALNPLGPLMEVGEGAPVRAVMVNPESLSGGSSFMPAYTITEFYDLKPGAIADDRFVLPQGYQQHNMADMGRAPQ